MIKNLNKNLIFSFLAIILCIIFISVGTIVSVHRFWQYEAFYIDFGQYDQAIWAISRFQPPMLDHWILGYIPIFADHFTPSIFLLSPLYWFTSNSIVILIAQAVAVGLSGLVLYSIAKEVIKDRFLSIAIMFCYYLFVGLQNAVITEFHEITVMTLFFMLSFWAFVKKKRFLYFVFLIITLGFKEITFLIGIFLGVAIFFIDKKWRKEAVATIIISVLWGVIALKIIIPFFSPGDYLYSEGTPPSITGKLTALFDHPLKRHTLFYSFFSFGFIPIFSPQFWGLMLQDYLSRFESQYFSTRWDLGLHYNAISAVILSLSTVYGIKFLMRYPIINKYNLIISILLIINALFLNRFILHGPFNLVYNKAFYRHTKEFAFLDKMIEMVPQNAVVATHNNLASRFTHQRVWLLKENYEVRKPDYILIDNREGQNPNNYTASESMGKILKKLLRDSNYKIIYNTKEQFVFKKI